MRTQITIALVVVVLFSGCSSLADLGGNPNQSNQTERADTMVETTVIETTAEPTSIVTSTRTDMVTLTETTSITATQMDTETVTATPTITATPTVTATATATSTATETPTPTQTDTETTTPTQTPTPTETETETVADTPTTTTTTTTETETETESSTTTAIDSTETTTDETTEPETEEPVLPGPTEKTMTVQAVGEGTSTYRVYAPGTIQLGPDTENTDKIVSDVLTYAQGVTGEGSRDVYRLGAGINPGQVVNSGDATLEIYVDGELVEVAEPGQNTENYPINSSE